MNTLQKTTTLKSNPVTLDASKGEMAEIEERAGVLGRLTAGLATQRAAGLALKATRIDEINSLASIRSTALALATASTKAAMVAEALPALGTLTTQLNMATGSVDQSLTNGAAAETYTHFTNRQHNLDLISTLLAEGKITNEEASILKQQIQEDSYTDIHRTRERTETAKATVAAIHSHGVATIQHAKDSL